MTLISKQFNLEGKVAIVTGSSKGIGKSNSQRVGRKWRASSHFK